MSPLFLAILLAASSWAQSPAPSATKSAKLSKPPHVFKVVSAPVDPDADAAAQKLYKRLRARYGKKTYSGQTTGKNFIAAAKAAGNTPVVRAFDMIGYSPQNPYMGFKPVDDGSVGDAIQWFESMGGKGIVEFQWHWFSPLGGEAGQNTFETKPAHFDVSKAVVDGTPENKAVLRDIDAIAAQLKRLQDKGVPVLWRPLHEAAGGWFWWGAKGPGPCLKLYDLLFERLTKVHKLHNLLWVWSEPDAAWYPGNAKVDAVGYDSYPTGKKYPAMADKFDELYALTGGEKLIALTETGEIPGIDAAYKAQAPWSWFVVWEERYQTDNSPEHLKEVYAHPNVITIERN